jgi:hypothetical protein
MRVTRGHRSRILVASVVAGIVTLTSVFGSVSAHATWLTYQSSLGFQDPTKPIIGGNYDIQQLQFGVNDTDLTKYYFYAKFKDPVLPKMFSDGLGSYLAIEIDSNLDSNIDYLLKTDPMQPYDGKIFHSGLFIKVNSGHELISSKCEVETFTDLAAKANWIGFSLNRDCLPLGTTIGIKGISVRDPNGNNEFQVYPGEYWKISLPEENATSSSTTKNNLSAHLANLDNLPTAPNTAPTLVTKAGKSPDDLVALAATEVRSVVTITCGNSLGSGWSARVNLSPDLIAGGYASYIITNQHVIKDCIFSGDIKIILSDQTKLTGYLWASDEVNDVAAIAVKSEIPPLEWQGFRPQQGWWAGVVGSPLGIAGILTTGLISSLTPALYFATTTAPINSGNSGGPVFDRTGRVLGIATAKYAGAEGFGIIHGAPMLCGKVIVCPTITSVWAENTNSPDFTSATAASPSTPIANQLALRVATDLILRVSKNSLADSIERLAQAIIRYPVAKADIQLFRALAPVAPGGITDSAEQATSVSIFANQVITFRNLVNRKLESVEQAQKKSAPLAKSVIASVTVLAKPSAKFLLKQPNCANNTKSKTAAGTALKCPNK